MSNASLQEQLQALSLGASPNSHEKKEKRSKIQSRSEKTPAAKQQKPAWLEYAQYGVELLKAHFPLCFKEIKDIQPLKVGIKQDLVKLLGTREDIVIGDKACMVNSLAYYVNSAAYHKSVVPAATRIDLNGEVTGTVSADEATYSSECRKAKLQKRKTPHHGPAKAPESATT